MSPEEPTYLPRRLLTAREPVVALCPRKVHTADKRRTQRESVQIPCSTHAPAIRAEFREPTLRIHPFTSKRFHVLLNSLFKVLFNFPSRYLSAIGLTPVFSLRWSLPPALGCIRKQPDSEETVPRGDEGRYRPHTVRGWEPLSEGLRPPIGTRATAVSYTPHVPRPGRAGIRRWALPSSLAATGGILVSFFSSA